MKYLLDTHILIWYFKGNEKLSEENRSIIENNHNEIYYSPLSIYEIDNKRAKHPDKMPEIGEEIVALCQQDGIKVLPFTEKHALELVNLKRRENTPPHNDPFDKMMLCQAISEDMLFMTHDSRIAEYDTPNIYKV